VRGISADTSFDKVEMYIYSKPEESDQLAGEDGAERRGNLQESGTASPGSNNFAQGDIGFGRNDDLRISRCGRRAVASGWKSHRLERHGFSGETRQHQYRDDKGKTRFVHTLNGSGLDCRAR